MTSNVDKLTEYIISNAGRLNPDKIRALASVVEALGGEKNTASHEPNTLPVAEEDELVQDEPIDFSEVDSVQIDGGRKRTVNIVPERHG